MPPIVIERVLSVNSEDPAHPAENLLKSDNNKKWKCKTGEKQAIVIVELKQSTAIEAIDVGNEHSAFVEVLVGRSSSPNEDYKVLLVASSLMTLREAKDSVSINGVRFFKKADLTKPTCDEKWDRVKIVCTQPFNKHVQYGLSFVTLHAAGDSGGSGETSVVLGRFALKEDKEDSPAVGSWFAKRKDPPAPLPPGAAAAARDASSPASIARGTNKKPTPRRPKADTPKNGALKPDKAGSKTPTPKRDPVKVQKPLQFQMSLADEDSPADDTDADSTYSPTKDSASVLSDDEVIPDDSDGERPQKRTKRAKKDNSKDGAMFNGQTAKQKVNDSGGKKPPKETKPFNRLLEGVTIVISGYQNPLRGELRSKACAMGARYKADWDNTCTHLICAFVNTPKFNQVQGRGNIVKKDWVEKCHSQRKRLPWRRFALDRNDAGTSSEEEIWEEGSVPTTSGANTSASGANTIASGANRRRVSSGSGSDTEEEIEKVKARQAQTKKAVKPADKPPDKPTDPFSADTDIESDSETQTENLPLPPLPKFFTNMTFHIASDINNDERRKLHRYIVAYNGSVADEMDGSVEYTITRLPDIAAEIQEEFGISCINPEWIWECSDAGRFIPVNQFIL